MGTFDLASLDTATRSEEGVEMTVIHPKTRQPILREEDGKPIAVTLLGGRSDTYRKLTRQIQTERAERAGRQIRTTPEDIEAEDTRLLVACTRGWTFDLLDGSPFPWNAENAFRLWSDKRFQWLRDRAVAFMQEDGNFLAS